MKFEITEQEKQLILQSMNVAVKVSENALQAAAELLPIATRLSALKDEASGNTDN